MKKYILLLAFILSYALGFGQAQKAQNIQQIKVVDENGAAYGVKNIDGKVRTSSMLYTYDIADGNVPGHSPLFKFGANDDIGTSFESVWKQGGLYPWAAIDAAEGIVKVSSDDVNDGGTVQIETATVVGAITAGGNAEVVITSATMTGSPKTIQVAVAGTLQVETQTIVGTIDATGAGDIDVIVTGALVTGSPLTVNVAVANDDTDSDVAGKVRTGLGIAAITDNYTVSGSGADIVLTTDAYAADDATLNIAYSNGTATGLTDNATSVNTTAGEAQDDQDDIATKIRAALNLDASVIAKYAVSGTTDKVILTTLTSLANDATLNISIDNGTCTGITIAATSADTQAGVLASGAQTVTIYGLSTTGAAQNETISLTGQTAVNSTLEYSRVFRMIVNTAGSSGYNEGTVYVGTGTVTTGAPAVVWSTIAPTLNQTLQAIWTVPAGKTLYVTGITVMTNSNKGTTINMCFKPQGEVFQIKDKILLFSSNVVEKFTVPLVVTALTDIDFIAIGSASGGGISVTFEGWYE